VTNSKLYLSPRKCPDARILHHFVVSFRGPLDPSPEGSLASLTPFSVYPKAPITTKVVSSKSVHAKVYSIQHYLIMINSDLVQVGGFLRVLHFPISIRRDWRYQRGNQNPYIEEKQTTQWPKEKVQKDKQWSTEHTHKTNDRVTRTTLKTESELICSGRVSSSCSISGTRRANQATNIVQLPYHEDKSIVLLFFVTLQ
jgi:hypothetical protein